MICSAFTLLYPIIGRRRVPLGVYTMQSDPDPLAAPGKSLQCPGKPLCDRCHVAFAVVSL